MNILFSFFLFSIFIYVNASGCFYDPFDGMNDSASLKFSGITLTHLPKKFITSATTKFVILQSNKIENIDSGAFDGLPLMKTLDLSKNNLSPINFFTFGYHENLEAIILDDNFNNSQDASELEIQISNSYPRLKYLSLRNVGLKVINFNLTAHFPSLSHLDLSNNDVSSDDVFSKLTNTINSLCLDGTGLSGITSVDQNLLQNIRNISINNNNLTNITFVSAKAQCLSNIQAFCLRLPNLISFSATNCSVETFEVQESLPLRTLDLRNNAIDFIQNTTLYNLPYLKYLSMSYNPISKMINMAYLPRLETLTMDKIDPEMVYIFLNSIYSSSLRNLSLSNNSLKSIPVNVLKNFRNLAELNLSNNLLESLYLTAVNVYALKRVNVSDNAIVNFDNVRLTNHLALELLDIRRNPLSAFNMSSLIRMPKNVQILFGSTCS